MAAIDQVKKERNPCQNLRTKAYYIPALRNEQALLEDGISSQYWCTRTLATVGPDDQVVCPSECSTLRPCYE